MKEKNVVIIGAGVSGLTTALLLSQNPRYKIVVAAKHMPGDYDPAEYASPWAGANYMPVTPKGTKLADYDAKTWPPLEKLARDHPESGVHFQDCMILNRSKDAGSATAQWFSELLSPSPWFKDVVPNFTNIPSSDLPTGITSATSFTSVCINTALYLPYLTSRCLSRNVTFRRAVFPHLLAPSHNFHPNGPTDLIVNCTGLSSHSLPGVQDKTMYPARGQIVLVRNTSDFMLDVSGTDDGDGDACYLMTRAAGGGTVLGGCYQKHKWDTEIDTELSKRIMKRCLDVHPQLVTGENEKWEGLSVVREGVGLRPVREGGVRVEREWRGNVWVVHNYGHGGAGYQSSYGCAEEVVRLVEEVLGEAEAEAEREADAHAKSKSKL